MHTIGLAEKPVSVNKTETFAGEYPFRESLSNVDKLRRFHRERWINEDPKAAFRHVQRAVGTHAHYALVGKKADRAYFQWMAAHIASAFAGLLAKREG